MLQSAESASSETPTLTEQDLQLTSIKWAWQTTKFTDISTWETDGLRGLNDPKLGFPQNSIRGDPKPQSEPSKVSCYLWPPAARTRPRSASAPPMPRGHECARRWQLQASRMGIQWCPLWAPMTATGCGICVAKQCTKKKRWSQKFISQRVSLQ